LRIGIIHPYFRVIGGAEKSTQYLSEALKKTNHFTTLYTCDTPPISETKNFKIRIFQNILPVIVYNYQKWQDFRKLYKNSEKEDVIIINGGGLMLDEINVDNVILYCHSSFDSEFEYINKKFTGVKDIINKIRQSFLRKKLSYIKDPKIKLISNSNYTKNVMKNRFGRDSTVVYPPVNLETYSKLYDLPKTNKVITITRLSTEKNLEFAANVAKNTGLQHVIAGRFDLRRKWYVDNLRKIYKNKNISWFPNMPSLEKEQALSSSKVFFHPARETFGISVVEAIAAGCIPIVPNNSANIETVPYDELRFNEKEDAIEKLQNAASGKYDYLKPNLKKHIEKFSIESYQKGMLKELESLSMGQCTH